MSETIGLRDGERVNQAVDRWYERMNQQILESKLSNVELPKRTRVYLSGPMTGYPEYNFPAFFAAADAVRELGYEVINPAEGVTDKTKPWQWYMRRALKLLLDADEIWMLPGWEDSTGARLELAVAESLSMPARFDNLGA